MRFLRRSRGRTLANRGLPGGLCLLWVGGAMTAAARVGGSQHSPRAPAARKDGSAAIFAPGRRDRSSPWLRGSRPGGGLLLGTRVISSDVTLGVYQRPYIRVHERPLVLHAEKVDTVGINSTESCPSVTGVEQMVAMLPSRGRRACAASAASTAQCPSCPARGYVKPDQQKTTGF